METAKSACERDYLDDCWLGIKDPLGGYDHRRVQVAGFASFWLSEIEANNVTRSQHRAKPSQRPFEQSGVGDRCDPGEVL